ncbi:hypothetical protein GTY54_51175 [Streptomyces sp. SID625]|nr:hypothetical protein [Streptomyces sp. SID625]MYR64232.1 hypothetical protein [Streptomyces sp. SID625]
MGKTRPHVGPQSGSESAAATSRRRSPAKLPNQEREDRIREALRFLHLQRTAHGTFDDDGQLKLSDSTSQLIGGQITGTEIVRLRSGLAHWRERAVRLVHASLTHLSCP